MLRGALVYRQGPQRYQHAASSGSPGFHVFGGNGVVVYAHSGIDIALWDIAGKRGGGALSDLLGGGRRKTVEAYSSLMRFSNPKTVKRICAERAARPCRLGASTVSADRRQFDHQYPWSISETVYLRKEPSDTPDVSRGCIPQNSRAGAP